MEIILLRHGKPTLELKGNMNSSEFKELAVAYAQSGIKDSAPKQLKERFDAHYIVCSDLERSIQSAKSIGVKEIHLIDPLFKESDIPYFEQRFFKLPVTVWLVLYRLMWMFGFSKNGESYAAAKNRAYVAASKLITLAEEHDKVLLVGHGLMNRIIAKRLCVNNWTGPISPGKKYWEFGIYYKL